MDGRWPPYVNRPPPPPPPPLPQHRPPPPPPPSGHAYPPQYGAHAYDQSGFQHRAAPTPPSATPRDVEPDGSVDVDADALRAMPKEERRALARIAKALLACKDEDVKAELAAELRKRCARAAANAERDVSEHPAPVSPTLSERSFGRESEATTTGRVEAREAKPPRFGAAVYARAEASGAPAIEAKTQPKKRKTMSEASQNVDFATSEERSARDDRARRFAREALEFSREVAKSKGRGTPTMQEMKMIDASAVGTNTSLEKTYLRLTEAPSMATVRPPSVLERALELVKSKWRANKDYEYAKDQLKSIRQDLTVQHIRDGALVLETYQTHARVALECCDLAEYNQCSAVLKSLHAHALERAVAETSTSRSTKKRKKSMENAKRHSFGGDEAGKDGADKLEGVDEIAEFAAYRLIYAAGAGAKSERAAALSRELRDVPDVLKTHAYVKHAFQVCEALASSNFHRFFSLYDIAPRMSAHLMDVMSPAVRADAFRALLRAHAPTIPVSFIASSLGFSTDDECAEYLESNHSCAFRDATRADVDVKATNAELASAADANRVSALDRLSRF